MQYEIQDDRALLAGAAFALFLIGPVALFFFQEGAVGYGVSTIAAGALIYGMWGYHWWRQSSQGEVVPKVATLSPREAMALSPGTSIRDGEDVLTVQKTERDRRRETESKVVISAVDADGREWGLPITERTVPGPSATSPETEGGGL